VTRSINCPQYRTYARWGAYSKASRKRELEMRNIHQELEAARKALTKNEFEANKSMDKKVFLKDIEHLLENLEKELKL